MGDEGLEERATTPRVHCHHPFFMFSILFYRLSLSNDTSEPPFLPFFPAVCPEASLADIVFVVDSSTSIGPQNFQKVKNFLHSVVLGLDIGSQQVQVGLVQYSDNIHPVFQLRQSSQKSVVLEWIRNLPYSTGGTNTGSALEFVRANYLAEMNGSRAKDGVPQIVILVTDGESNDEVQDAADQLKRDGVFVYVVGINVQDVQELQKIASEPFEKFLFNTENFSILQEFAGSLLQALCSAVEGQMESKSCSIDHSRSSTELQCSDAFPKGKEDLLSWERVEMLLRGKEV